MALAIFAGHQLDGADGIVVGGDGGVDLIRVAVGVHHGDHRDAHSLGLGDGDALLGRVNDKEGVGQGGHFLDAAQLGVHLLDFLGELLGFFLGQAGQLALGLLVFQPYQVIDAALNGGEIGERAAYPALVDIEHAGALGLFLDDGLGLFLGADEEYLAAVAHDVLDEIAGLGEHAGSLFQVDDVDAVALGEDIFFHARMPPAGLVTEVSTGL